LIASVCEATRPAMGIISQDDEERAQAAATLRRLVTFTASALDVRFAFVVAFADPDDPAQAPAVMWLGKDFGLRSACAEVAWSDRIDALPEIARVLRAAFPHEADLGRCAGATTSLPLRDADGRVLGHLGIADPTRGCSLAAREQLRTLLPPAIVEVARWSSLR
jgi:hypothetical protein